MDTLAYAILFYFLFSPMWRKKYMNLKHKTTLHYSKTIKYQQKIHMHNLHFVYP